MLLKSAYGLLFSLLLASILVTQVSFAKSSGFKTFNDPVAGYKIKIPSGWSPLGKGNNTMTTSFTPKDVSGVFIIKVNDNAPATLDEFVSQFKNNMNKYHLSNIPDEILSEQPTTLGGIPADKIRISSHIITDTINENILAVHNGKTYWIAYNTNGMNEFTIFPKMLDSFQFLN